MPESSNVSTLKKLRWLATTACVGCAVALSSTAASAQEAASTSAPTPQPASDSGAAAGDIIVTANKREESVQKVPIAISAFTGEQLASKGVTNPMGLMSVTPNLTIGQDYAGGAQAALRGVGSVNVFPGGDPGVPIYVDGHYTQSTSYIMNNFLDVARVEVLRGPQGTLYGRNAMGGSINIITANPTDRLEGYATVGYGNYDDRTFEGVINVPVSPRFRLRAAVSSETRDGYIKNISGKGFGSIAATNALSGRLKAELDLTDNFTATIAGYAYRDTAPKNGLELIGPYPTGRTSPYYNYWSLITYPNITATDPWKINVNLPVLGKKPLDEARGASVDLSWKLPGVTIRSLSAFNYSKTQTQVAKSGSPDLAMEEDDDIQYKTFSQELQLVSTSSGPFQWILGAYYYRETDHQLNNYIYDDWRETGQTAGTLGFLNTGGTLVGSLGTYTGTDAIPYHIYNDVRAESAAAYGQADWSLTDKLKLTAGFRWSYDKKTDYSGQNNLLAGVNRVYVDNASASWSEPTGKAVISYQFTPEVNAYASYSRGYKSGGFNLLQVAPYAPEKVNAYEVGMKSQLFDRRLQMNLAAFYYDYQDKQESYRNFTTQQLALTNAAKARTYGFELEAVGRPTDALTINVGLSYLNARYSEFSSFDTSSLAAYNLGNQNLKGNVIPYSPSWKGSVGLNYQWDLGATGKVDMRVDAYGTTKIWAYYWNRPGIDDIPGYIRENASLTWSSENGNWKVQAYVNNITNRADQSYRVQGGTINGVPAPVLANLLPPRTFGLKVTRKFQ
jgi:iron complex outermembrane recepter protein